MKLHSLSVIPLAVVLAGALARPGGAAEAPPNTLTAAEKAAGWRLLFDGRTSTGWRGFLKQTFPTTGWVIEDGWLKKLGRVRGGDILTLDQFTDFELSWEWRIPKGANNGVKYFMREKPGGVGHEYQMIDDSKRGPSKGGTASFYAVLAPRAHQPVKLAPEINHSRLVIQGDHVEHWLNGEQVLEYQCGSPEVMAGVASSKFKNVPDFGKKMTAPILLTDHSSECWYRNIKLRVLPAK